MSTNVDLVIELTLVLEAVKSMPKEPRNQTGDDEKALMALSDAYHTTLQYYEFLKHNPRDRASEAGVAQKWEIVGILMQKYDRTLAERLDAKSRYWLEGATWSEDVIRQAGIGLESIRREVKLRIRDRVA